MHRKSRAVPDIELSKIKKSKCNKKSKTKNKIKWADDVSIGRELVEEYKKKNGKHDIDRYKESEAFKFRVELNDNIIPYLEECRNKSGTLGLCICIRLFSMKAYLNDTLSIAKKLKKSLDRYYNSGYPIDFWLGKVYIQGGGSSSYDLGSENKVNKKIENLKARVKKIKIYWPSVKVKLDIIDIKTAVISPLSINAVGLEAPLSTEIYKY